MGEGQSTFFWSDPWMDGRCIGALMPKLLDAVLACARRRRTVASTLVGHAWIRDITGALTITVLMQYLHLRQQLDAIALSPGVDRMIWKWNVSGQYSSSSAYTGCYTASRQLLGAKELWKVKAWNEFKFFF
jgi:hypothetical protein